MYYVIRRERINNAGVLRQQWWDGKNWIEWDDNRRQPKVWKRAAAAHKVGEAMARETEAWTIYQDAHRDNGAIDFSERKYGYGHN